MERTFDRSWSAAQAAAEDVAVTITDVDRSRGTILGYKDASTVTISVRQQADGSVRGAFNVRAPSGPDTVLADHLSHAFRPPDAVTGRARARACETGAPQALVRTTESSVADARSLC